MTIELESVDFHPRHLDIMVLRDLELEGIFALDDSDERIQSMYENMEIAKTFFCDGRVIACAGFATLWPGVADGWILPSVYLRDHPMSFAKIIRQWIDNLFKEFALHRFQTTSYDDDFHARWMGWIGFEDEGLLKKYRHDGVSLRRYARVTE